MRNRAVKLILLLVAAVGATVAWQRRNETPPTAPTPRPPALGSSTLPASEPFMDPAPVMAAAPMLTPDVLPDPDERPGAVAPLEAGVEPAADAAAIAEADTPVTGTPVLSAVFVEEVAPDDTPTRVPPADQAPLPTPPHGPFAEAPLTPADDLKRISGVGPKLERLLNEQGITTFAQLAALDDEGVDRLQSRLPEFPGRVRRDGWVGQAMRFQG